MGELAIKAPSAKARAWSLSGGNQQRVVLAKWLATDPKVFILDGPTIGIDIASKRNIHEIIRSLAERGIAIIMISDEIPEILHNCNRVLVMREGKLEAEIREAAGAQEADLLTAIAGKKGNEARA
jgi:simple sugar transport system ATP-binding protein